MVRFFLAVGNGDFSMGVPGGVSRHYLRSHVWILPVSSKLLTCLDQVDRFEHCVACNSIGCVTSINSTIIYSRNKYIFRSWTTTTTTTTTTNTKYVFYFPVYMMVKTIN